MMHRKQGPMYFVMFAGLVGVLALGGCAKKNVMATTSGTETAQGDAGMQGDGGPGGKGKPGMPGGPGFPGGPGGPEGQGKAGSDPLKGFAKTPKEESVKESLKPSQPMAVAKADPKEIEARRAQEAGRRELRDIYFAFDKWALSNEGKKNLVESKEYLQQNPNAKLLIEGHCDERGSREYNLVLGEKRAKEVRRYLSDLGIKNKVIINSYGKERPVCNEQDESCFEKNRRAHLVVEGGQ